MKLVFLIVLDSYGCGAMPDADAFGDAGVSTINSVSSKISKISGVIIYLPKIAILDGASSKEGFSIN